MKHILSIPLLLVLIIMPSLPAFAQDSDRAMTTVEIEAADGLMLVGDYYLPEDVGAPGAPAVLLMHMLGSNRAAYEPLIAPLVEAGYVVLNVDVRGHGSTGGPRDWDVAVVDTQAWLDWLREQDGVNDAAVGIIGGSIGSNLAIIGCANDDACVTVIALSPGLDYQGVQPGAYLDEALSKRSALLIASHNDRYSAESVEQLFVNAPGNVTARLYRGNAHGTNLFNNERESVTTIILAWLDEYLR